MKFTCWRAITVSTLHRRPALTFAGLMLSQAAELWLPGMCAANPSIRAAFRAKAPGVARQRWSLYKSFPVGRGLPPAPGGNRPFAGIDPVCCVLPAD
jgi:hypothetical protein